MAGYRQNADWSEEDHPRDEDGKFAKSETRGSSGSEESKSYRQNTKYEDILQPSTGKLTKKQWAQFYDRLSDIKNGSQPFSKLKNNTIAVLVDDAIVLSTGDYERPKATGFIAYKDQNELDAIIGMFSMLIGEEEND